MLHRSQNDVEGLRWVSVVCRWCGSGPAVYLGFLAKDFSVSVCLIFFVIVLEDAVKRRKSERFTLGKRLLRGRFVKTAQSAKGSQNLVALCFICFIALP